MEPAKDRNSIRPIARQAMQSQHNHWNGATPQSAGADSLVPSFIPRIRVSSTYPLHTERRNASGVPYQMSATGKRLR
jgi:hypothetical protein